MRKLTTAAITAAAIVATATVATPAEASIYTTYNDSRSQSVIYIKACEHCQYNKLYPGRHFSAGLSTMWVMPGYGWKMCNNAIFPTCITGSTYKKVGTGYTWLVKSV